MDETTKTKARQLVVKGLKEGAETEKGKNDKPPDYLTIISIILGIAGLFIAGIIFGSLSVFFGNMAKKKKQRFAIIGIILGVLGILSASGLIIYHGISERNISSHTVASLIAAFIFVIFWGTMKSKNQKKQNENRY